MSEFSDVLRPLLIEMLVQSGMAIIERDHRELTQWNENDDFRDDDDLDQLELEIRKNAKNYAEKILMILHSKGFQTEKDVITRKQELSGILEEIVNKIISELKEGDK